MATSVIERSCDQLLHDLARAPVDSLHTGVGVGMGYRLVENVAVAAEQLQALIDDRALRLAAVELGYRSRCRIKSAIEVQPHALIDKCAEDFETRLAVGQNETSVLVVEAAFRKPCAA